MYCTQQNTTIKMADGRIYGYSVIHEGSNILGVTLVQFLKKKKVVVVLPCKVEVN